MVRIALIAASLLPAPASAKEKADAPKTKYYYSVAAAESPEWAYPVPECKPLAGTKYAALRKAKKCRALTPASQSCESGETAVLENVADRRKERFKLNHIVFGSLAECQADREGHLQGEE